VKPAAVFTLTGVAILSGCAAPFRAPPDVAHIQLSRTNDSTTVMVSKIWLERKRGALLVRGYVVKRLSVTDTTGTHLDVTLFDASDKELRSTVEHFLPRQIPRLYRRPDYSSYNISLDPLPATTARIDVRAHEGNHS